MADEAVMAIVVALLTGAVEMGNEAELLPAATVTDAGTVAVALPLLKLTNTPPAGAGATRVTVPVEAAPLATVEGESVNEPIVPTPGCEAPMLSAAVTVLADCAVMEAIVALPTGEVVTVNVPLAEPAGMVRVAGSPAAPLLLLSAITTPPLPAAAANVTVPVAGLPPVTEAGDSVNPRIVLEAGAAGLIVSPAVTVVRDDAVIVAIRKVLTAVVGMAKVPILWPAGIVRLEGSVAAVSELDRLTETPPIAAGRTSVTVPVAVDPPVTVLGETERVPIAARAGADVCTRSVPLTVLAEVAVMVTVVFDETGMVDTGNVPLADPAAMRREAGTDAAVLLLDSVTSTPPAPAGDPNVTVPVAAPPPPTADGATEMLPIVPVPAAEAG